MISFELDIEGNKRVMVHTRKEVAVSLHPKSGENEEFLVIDHYDPETREFAQMFLKGEAIDALLEQIGKVVALRFKP